MAADTVERLWVASGILQPLLSRHPLDCGHLVRQRSG